MNTNDINAIRKVCETGSIAKAASQLFMTPQAVSLVVKRVENEVGINLFDRVPAGMNMNEYGKLFYERSENLIKELAGMSEMFHLDINNKSGVLRVAFSQGIIVMLDISYIMNFTKLYPNFRLEFIEGPDKKVEELVATGKADIGITTAPTFEEGFYQYNWCRFPCCAVVSKNHPLGDSILDKDVITLGDLKDIPIVLENKDFSIYREFKKICSEKHGFYPNIYFETVEIENALGIASEGYAVAITPLPVAQATRRRNLHIARIDEDLYWQWAVIKPKSESISEIEQVFLNHLFEKTRENGWFDN